VREITEAPRIGRLQPGAVVEEPVEGDLEHSLQLVFIVNERGHWIREVRDERHD